MANVSQHFREAMAEAETTTEESAVAAMGRAMMQPVEETPKALDLGATLSARMTQKRQVIETAKATLADAIALEGKSDAAANAVSETQGKAINILAQGTVAGLVDKAQVTAILGDAYGYAVKADGTPGKTPKGAGNTLRKRVVTLSEAYAYVNGDIAEADKPKWMAEHSPETLAPLVSQWLEGNLSPWQAYKDMTAKESKPSVALHFDAAKLLKLVEALEDNATLEAIKGNPALVAAYEGLIEAFNRDPLAF